VVAVSWSSGMAPSLDGGILGRAENAALSSR
jgi:hypothetical protein